MVIMKLLYPNVTSFKPKSLILVSFLTRAKQKLFDLVLIKEAYQTRFDIHSCVTVLQEGF